MNSHTTQSFRDALALLPIDIQKRARAAYLRFRTNPRHPGLDFKKVHPRDRFFQRASTTIIGWWVSWTATMLSGSGSANTKNTSVYSNSFRLAPFHSNDHPRH